MDTKTLNSWAELLLDMGKRNNLVNFKSTKMSTAEIVVPNVDEVFHQVTHSAVFEVYDPKLENDEEEFVTEDPSEVEKDVANTKINKERYIATFSQKIKKGQILLFNSSGKPLQSLKNISKKGKTAIEETGVNIVYLAFGFINWTEDENSQYAMKAPILLIPISIENDSAVEPFCIKVLDDEITVNPTFTFKLQNEYGIQLPEYDEDADLGTYFDRIGAILSKLKWTVSHECHIGVFSFLKINMYQDIKNNGAVIAKSKNVMAMMGAEVATAGSSLQNEEYDGVTLLEQHNVVDADSSQAEAIEMAKEGKSFVLQGPPGTGKSQTITNIIAEFLHDGKTVLFVSEKLAALNVVYDKLKKAGLEEFCLELHSHKTNKKQVIDELCHTLRAERHALSDKAQNQLEIRRSAQEKLDSYARELHTIRPVINKTLYQLYEEVSACRVAPSLSFAIPNLKGKGDSFADGAVTLLEHYVDYVPTIGYDYHNHPWFGCCAQDVSYQARSALEEDLKRVSSLCAELGRVSASIAEKFNIHPNSIRQFTIYQNFFGLVKDSRFISGSLLDFKKIQLVLENAKQMQILAKEILDKKTYLDNIYDDGIYQIDGETTYKMLTRQFAGAFSRLFNKDYKSIIASLRLNKKDAKKPKYKMAIEYIEVLRDYQSAVENFDRLEGETVSYLGTGYAGLNTDFEQLIKDIGYLSQIDSDGIEYGSLAGLSANEFENKKADFCSIYEAIYKCFADCSKFEIHLAELFDPSEFDILNVRLKQLSEKCSICIQNIDQLDQWWEFFTLMQKIKANELKGFVDEYVKGNKSIDVLPLSFKKTFYSQWIDAILHEAPVLMELSRVPHDDIVKRFKEKDQLNFEINKAKIRASVSAKRPRLDMVAQGSAIAILLREGEKKRKQKSVRQLLADIGDLALALKPCFLMSPLSVSTFLDSSMQFDAIVFDEASQIFPQDAIGAIYRGKQLIVVGDSKQMPPSNFFNSSSEIDFDEENEDESITDFESILDLCSISFPQRRLKWHYRSRYEQLISFSNKNFYDNELVSFPSVKENEKGVGIDYYYCDGVFDRQTKTNRVEAEKIVDLVFENIEKYPGRSLGVVAFSVAQQSLIDKLIFKRRQADPSKESFFASDVAEPFFVKNLETVQGDERDTIIFSIAYAKDSTGRLLLNFGPINREGGERRLNVAVTRAKYNVQLVTSMHYSDIDLSRTQSVGARLLREYLDYAENGRIALERSISVSPFDQFDSEFEMEVCEFLRNNGYEVDTQVGCSSFKIDLALKSPGSSNYLLAIECDGAAYHSARTARDRDRLRQSILENMGWKFYRIWSTDWFRNKKNEQTRLLNAVREASEAAPKTQSIEEAPVSFEEKAVENHFEFPKYKMVDVSSIQSRCQYDVVRIIRVILEQESPVSEEWILKRIAHLYGREKVTNVVVGQFESDMRNCRAYGIVRKNGYLYLQGAPIPMLRVPDGITSREIKYISLEELANGIEEMLRQNVSADKMGLFRLIAQQLGVSRMGDAILSRFESALELLGSKIKADGYIISLK